MRSSHALARPDPAAAWTNRHSTTDGATHSASAIALRQTQQRASSARAASGHPAGTGATPIELHNHPVQTPSLSERHAAVARALLADHPRVRAAFSASIERARSGELPAVGTAVMSRELGRAELADLRSRQGRAMGQRRAEAFQTRREARARELGYRDLATYLHERYAVDGARVEDLARELGAALSAVVAAMDQAGIPRRSRGGRAARANASRRTN